MSPREALRRVTIWVTAAASIAITIWIAINGSPLALIQNTGLTAVGAVILTSRPGNRIGLIALLSPLLIVPAQALEVAGLAASVPAWVESALTVLGSISMLTLPLAVVLYPSGMIRTRSGRWIAVALAVVTALTIVTAVVDPYPLYRTGRANPSGVPVLLPLFGPPEFQLTEILWLAAIGLSVVALVEMLVRWRRSAASERLQYRWFAFGVSIVLMAVLLGVAAMFDPWSLVLYAVALNAIPLTIGIAVTRHGLYQIDRVISRTVAYGIVTLLAVGVYIIVVTSVTWLLPGAPSIAVAAATLAGAALFLPVLRWVQRIVDRRFDRERYDAARIVDAFGEQLRTAVDPARTTGDLATAVDKALQPASLGLWTREVRDGAP
jgi:hypothetical protein